MNVIALNPQPGDRIILFNTCLVVTRRPNEGAVEYDLLELRIHGAGKNAPTSWRKIEERICDLQMWEHYATEGRLS